MWPFKKGKENFESFAEKCVEELKALQDKFENDYDISWYQNRFYSGALLPVYP